MSIATEISRISGNVSDALTAISNKGVTVPSGSNSDDLADLIGQIQQGGNYQAKTVTPSSSVQVITADQGGTETFLDNSENLGSVKQRGTGTGDVFWVLSVNGSSPVQSPWTNAPIDGETYHLTFDYYRSGYGRHYIYDGDILWTNGSASFTAASGSRTLPMVISYESLDTWTSVGTSYYGYIRLMNGMGDDDNFGTDTVSVSVTQEVPHYDALSQVTVLAASGGGGIVITDTTDAAGGTIRTITATEISGTKTITQNGTGIDVASYAAVDVAVPSGGSVNMPTFTVTWSNDWETLLSVTADKTFQECKAYIGAGTWNALVTEVNQSGTEQFSAFGYMSVDGGASYLVYSVAYQSKPVYDIRYNSDGTIQVANPSAMLQPLNITTNGTYYPTGDFSYIESVNVNVSGGTYQAKTHITPTESSITVTPDPGFDALSSVQIDPISSTYVGSGITRRSSTDLTASGATVTVPAGYYSAQASKAVTSGSATAPASISGTAATVSTGTNTLTLTKTVSVTPSVTAGYVSSGTAGNSSVSLQASVTTKAAATIHPSTSDQTIASGTYTTGAQTIKAVTLSNLTAENIKSGVVVNVGDSTDADCVASVTGTYTGGGGGGIGTLLNTTSIGSVSTSSTSAASLNISLSVSNINNYDLLIVESSVNSVTNNRHTATVGVIYLTASSSVGTKNGATIATAKWNSKISSTGTTTTSVSTTAYGIYPNSCSVSNGTATIPMYRRYNSTSTGTINGTYTARVYGVNLYDLIGG